MTYGRMVRTGVAAALVLLPGPLAAQRLDDGVGVLTLQGRTQTETVRLQLESLFVTFIPDQASDVPAKDRRDLTVTARSGRPDPALLAWATGPEYKRRVTLELRHGENGRTRSTYELEGAQLTAMAISSAQGLGTQSMSIRMEHLKINGRTIY